MQDNKNFLSRVVNLTNQLMAAFDKSSFEGKKENREKNLAFSNTLYVCRNSKCERKFFRAYQVLELLKYRNDMEENATYFDLRKELHIADTMKIEVFEKDKKFVCPTCQKNLAERIKEYDWMKEAPDFPELSNYELKEFRKDFEVRKQSTYENIKEIEIIIEEKESLEAFQWQYKLDSSFNAENQNLNSSRQNKEEEISKMKTEIITQLNKLKESTPFSREKRRLIELITRVEKTPEERYKLM